MIHARPIQPSPPSEFVSLPEHLARESALPSGDAQHRVAALLRQFNTDVAAAHAHHAATIDASAKRLLPKDAHARLPPRAHAVLRRYAVADALALIYRDRTNTAFLLLVALAFGAILVFEYLAHLAPHDASPILRNAVLTLYGLLWVLCFAIYLRAHYKHFQRKYHDYRALAEGMRVQLFWHILNISQHIDQYYLRKQHSELEWIRSAIVWWRQHDDATLTAPSPSTSDLSMAKALVLKYWVQAQAAYYTQAAQRDHARSRTCKTLGGGCFCLSLLTACALWFSPDMIIEQRLFVIIAVLLAASALFIAYGERMAFAEHGRRFSANAILFHTCLQDLSPGPLTEADLAVFLQLGQEALQEHGDWLLLHRDRPLEVIIP